MFTKPNFEHAASASAVGEPLRWQDQTAALGPYGGLRRPVVYGCLLYPRAAQPSRPRSSELHGSLQENVRHLERAQQHPSERTGRLRK